MTTTLPKSACWGEYIVYENGDVWSERLKRNLAHIRAPRGYIQVSIGGKLRTLAHILVEAFHGVKPHRVTYLDGNPSNCTLSNIHFTPIN